MAYYDTEESNEFKPKRDKKGNIVLPLVIPAHVIELPDDNPFFSPLPEGKRLTYDSQNIPNGLEDIPAVDPSVVLEENKNYLYRVCYKFQVDNIDSNLSNEMTKSESLIEAGKATESDLPLAKENADWLDSLWSFYYSEKAKIEAGQEHSTDFLSSVGKVPNGFTEVRSERKGILNVPVV